MKKNSTKNWLKGTAKYLTLCCVLFAGTASYAQAPANDECTGSISVPVNAGTACTQTVAGTTISATGSAIPLCGLPSSPLADVWYTFTATNTSHIISAPELTEQNSLMAVYSGTCGTLTEILGCSPTNDTVSGLTAGSTYYLRIVTDPGINFTLCITTLPSPSALVNDECAGAISVPVNTSTTCTQTTAGTTIGATPSTNAMSCFPVGDYDDVWFSFTASAPEHIISVLNTTSLSGMAVYGGSCGALTEVFCNITNDTVSGLTAGNTYYLRILVLPGSNFDVCITTPLSTALTNDECAGAINISNGTPIPGSTAIATQSLPPASCDAVGTVVNDLWYSFTTGNTGGTVNLDIIGGSSSFPNVVMEIFDGTCGTLNSVACTTDILGIAYAFTAAPNTTYYLRMYIDDASDYDFDIQATGVPLPVTMDKLRGSLTAGNKAMLEWNTYSEHTNKGFDVMRSEDGKTFRSIGWIPSAAANGISSALIKYTFTDPQAISGKAFYKVRQVDLDGKTVLSNIIALSANQSNDVAMSVYPNPVKNLLNIDISGKTSINGHVTITDLMGKVLINHALSSNTATIDLGALPAGVYFVKYANSTASAVQKIVKE